MRKSTDIFFFAIDFTHNAIVIYEALKKQRHREVQSARDNVNVPLPLLSSHRFKFYLQAQYRNHDDKNESQT